MITDDDDNYTTGFVDGAIVLAVASLAVYGAVKMVQEIKKTPDQRLLEHLGDEIKRLEEGSER